MRHLLLLGLVAATTQASAQLVHRDSAPPTTVTIDQAIDIAQRNNPILQQTLNNRIGARAAVRSAYGALLPSADASLSAQRLQGGQQIFGGASPTVNPAGRLSVNPTPVSVVAEFGLVIVNVSCDVLP